MIGVEAGITTGNPIEIYRTQYAPLEAKIEVDQALLTSLNATERFITKVGLDIQGDGEIEGKIEQLYENNKTLRRMDESTKEKEGESVTKAAEGLLNEMRTYLRPRYGDVMNLIFSSVENPEDEGKIEEYVINSLAEYVHFVNKEHHLDTEDNYKYMPTGETSTFNDVTSKIREEDPTKYNRVGTYFGVGYGIGKRLVDHRILPGLIAQLKANGEGDQSEPADDQHTPLNPKDMVERALARHQKEELILETDHDLRKIGLHAWVREKARTRPRILETAWDKKIIDQIVESRRLVNGVAGAIAYGPPGTGKTEMFILANLREGFDTRVISMDEHTDFVRLVGEMPIPVGMDAKASNSQRLMAFRDFLQSTSVEDIAAAVHTKRIEVTDLIKFTPNLAQKLVTEGRALDQRDMKELKDELIISTNRRFLSVQLGEEAGMDTPANAWVYGEVIRAFKDGQRPLLDELDKAGSKSLDGLSYILSMAPGTMLKLGSEEFIIPPWARIDGTTNDLLVSAFLQNRFAPNLIEINYPPSEDLIQKACVWLADDEGNINLSFRDQGRLVAFFTHVVPRIQTMYTKQERELKNPLSMRNMNKFCQFIRSGHSLEDAVESFILKSGALTHEDSELIRLQILATKYEDTIDGPRVDKSIQFEPTNVNRVLESPLYSAVIRSKNAYNRVTEPRALELDADERKILTRNQKQKELQKLTESHLNEIVLETGLSIKLIDTQIQLKDRNGNILYRLSSNLAGARLKGASANGEEILVETKEGIALITPFSEQKTLPFGFGSSASQVEISGSGNYSVDHREDGIMMVYPLVSQESVSGMQILDEAGDPAKISRFELNDSGSQLLIETSSGDLHKIDMGRVLEKGKSKIRLKDDTQIAKPEGTWHITQNLLWSEDSPNAQLLK